jgi:hypothetical protein
MSLSSEKRIEILQLLADGKITADEAAELLTPASEAPAPPSAPKASAPVESEAALKATSNGGAPKWLHIHVSDLSSGKSKVKVNVPLRMVKFGLNMGKRFTPDIEGVDWDDLSRVMTEEEGVLVDVQDEEDGEHVRIFVD